MKKAGPTPPQDNFAFAMNISRGRVSTDNIEIQTITEAAAARLASVPNWAKPLPMPPQHDWLADVKEDRKLAAVMCAISRIAKNQGKTFTQQIDIWEAGE